MTDTLTNGDAWSNEAMEAFEIMPVGSLADYFFNMVDLDPELELRQTKQLKQVIAKRGISTKELSEAWSKLGAENTEA